MKKGKSSKMVYAFRVLVQYEGDLMKPSMMRVQSYLEESLGKSKVPVPCKIKLVKKEDGEVVVQGQNDVFYLRGEGLGSERRSFDWRAVGD